MSEIAFQFVGSPDAGLPGIPRHDLTDMEIAEIARAREEDPDAIRELLRLSQVFRAMTEDVPKLPTTGEETRPKVKIPLGRTHPKP